MHEAVNALRTVREYRLTELAEREQRAATRPGLLARVAERTARSPAKRACWTLLAACWFPALQSGSTREDEADPARDSDLAASGAASVREARISADGTRAVFAAERESDGTVELYCVPLDGGLEPIHVGGPLSSSGGYRWEIAADGRRVVYLGADLCSSALDGRSEPVRLGDPTATTLDFALGPDGSRVVHRAAPRGKHAGLFSVAIDGTRAIELVAANDHGPVEHTYEISSDGDTVVFLSRHEDGSTAKLYSAPIDGGPIVVLDHPRSAILDFRISSDGERVLYRCERSAPGVTALYTVPIDGSVEPVRLDAPRGAPACASGDVRAFELSAGGSRVVFLTDQGNGRNRLSSALADGSGAPIELARDVGSSFQVHPAGHLVLHTGDRELDEHFELRAVAIDGSAPPFVLSAPMTAPGHVGWFGVTADGTGIVYQARRDGDRPDGLGPVSELWRVSLDGLARTMLAETGDGRDFQLGPDGRRVFYRVEDSLCGLALDGGSGPVVLANDLAPGESFLVSPDGGRLLHRFRVAGAGGDGLASVHAGGGPPIRLLSPHARGGGAGGTQASSAGGGGFRGFSFGTSGVASPTGEKPESKLWWNDGSWWGSLYVDAAQDHRIHRLDATGQRWLDTGTVLDDRTSANADVLWDGTTQKLYVASHVFTTAAGPTPSSWGRLYRYSYDSAGKTYARDAGFPVDITRGSSEALTIAKDSQGRLWAAWVESSKVMVNHSLASDSAWRAPFVLPASPAAVSVSEDDICSIIAFGGNRVGVMWSNQLTNTVYFAAHLDGQADNVWQPEEVVLPGADCSGLCADDHMNLKADSAGRVFAVLKTSNDAPDQPLTLVVGRSPSGGWDGKLFGTVRDNHTRPLLMLDEQARELHVFAAPTGGGVIYHKSAPLSDPRFEPGLGTPFIRSATDTAINNPTSTKQNVDSRTGLVVLASDENTRFYLHNFLIPGGPGTQPPTISSFSPTSGPVGTSVTITGTSFGGATSVRFSGTPAVFGVVSGTQIRATVPSGATSGRISVTTPGGSATSGSVFTVTQQPPSAPTIDSFSPASGPAGTTVTINGTRFTGATSVRFNGSPAGFTLVSGTQIRATVPGGATSGRISVTTPGGTATSTGAFTVTRPPSIALFSPPSGPAGTSVTVTGAGFSGTTSVRFNGTPASFGVVSDTQIRASVPGGATSGRISVSTPSGTASSSAAFTVTRPPVIDSFLPALGFVLTPVTIFGGSFDGATSVKFDGKSANFSVLGNGLILATVPFGATTGKVSVTTPGGTATSSENFVVIGL